MAELNIYTDGASRGNPGEAGVGVIIYNNDGEELYEISEYIGQATNNIAEYTALLRGLDGALLFGTEKVNVFADSELMVKQMNGQYKVKNENLIPLYNEAKKKLKQFAQYTFNHVPREKNKRADKLANDGIDSKRKQAQNLLVSKEEIKINFDRVQVNEKVVRQNLAVGQESMVVKVTLDKDGVVPEHSHNNEQVCYIVKGSLQFVIEGEEKILKAGESMIIPRNVKHSAKALEDSEELDIFVPIRTEYL